MKKIVLTGGPCGGKSTAMAELKDCLEDRGYKVFVVEESATELINIGIKPFGENAIPMYQFQKIMMYYQLRKEFLIQLKAKLYKNSVILYDRGTIDNKSYLDELSWYRLLSELNLNESKLMNHYDQVIHLVTVADGKEHLYTTSNNEARTESADLARERDIRTLNAYVGHHNLKVVDNSTNFKDKINRVKNCILSELNEPLAFNNQYKFLVDLEKSNLEKLEAISTKSYILQDYLKSSEDIDRKVRKKLVGCNESYYLTIKRKVGNKEEIKTNRVISKLEYLYYLAQKDKSISQIKKIRYSFRDGKEIYNLDVFPNSKKAILENETTKSITDLKLPDFLKIISIEKSNINLHNKVIGKKKILKKCS